MKKCIKIFALVLFIILFFGITTSKVLASNVAKSTTENIENVDVNTDIRVITSALKRGDYEGSINLKGRALYIMRQHPNIFCRQKGAALGNYSATYKLDGGENGIVIYPEDDEEKGYQIAFILAYGKQKGYSKEDIQKAYWKTVNPNKGGYTFSNKAAELYYLGQAYNNFKKDEKQRVENGEPAFQLIKNEEKITTKIQGDKLIYGPIQVYYSYAKAEHGHGTFGGLELEFTGEGVVYDTYKQNVQLCCIKDGEYKTLDKDNSGRADGLVLNSEYSGKDLYVCIQYDGENAVKDSEIEMKIKYRNNLDVSATVYQIKGTAKWNTHGEKAIIYCMDCEEKMQKATGDYKSVVEKIESKEENAEDSLVSYDNKYWKYDKTTVEPAEYKDLSDDENAYKNSYNKYIFGNNVIPEEVTGTKHLYCKTCNKVFKQGIEEAYNHFLDTIHKENQMLNCDFCKNYIRENEDDKDLIINHISGECIDIKNVIWFEEQPVYNFIKYNGCKENASDEDDIEIDCGSEFINIDTNGGFATQNLSVLASYKCEEIVSSANIKIPITTSIEVTKEWEDYSNKYETRPENINLKVYRCVAEDYDNWNEIAWDDIKWEELNNSDEDNSNDYEIVWNKDDIGKWTGKINKLRVANDEGHKYYFKVVEEEPTYYDVTYKSATASSTTPVSADNYIRADVKNKKITITNSLEHIDIGGYVWLDEEEGTKPVTPPDGNYDDVETKVQGIKVYLYYINPNSGTASKVAETVTDANGYYKFEDFEIGQYYVQFEYDGINYEDTKKVEENKDNVGKVSKAFEDETDRNKFNAKFSTITHEKATGEDGKEIGLEYTYSDGKSTLITKNEDGTVKSDFIMNAYTEKKSENNVYKADTNDLNLGLVKREMDIALSTDVHNAEVLINGQETEYSYNKADNNIEIGSKQTNEQVSYNLNLYASDYNYRIRDYVTHDDFKQNDIINSEEPSGATTGEKLEVYVTYELNLQNQSTKTVYINEVKYSFDDKYNNDEKFISVLDKEGKTVPYTLSGNTITINLNSLNLEGTTTKTLYLVFKVNEINEAVALGDFYNIAEITSYSTGEGLIDTDSEPGNFYETRGEEKEDDSDMAGGLKIEIAEQSTRKITGKVVANDNENVNDVIVQLIELKTINDKVYEYIWQETVSGTGKGLRLNANGESTEEYIYDAEDGKYEFNGFIPGDYIVRFIYGDGKSYDLTDNVIKYNGQDYKSVADLHYNQEWYNTSSGASVARDNEARRLETMAYSVNIDAEKGLLLKLLDNSTLNLTEKENLISIYNKYNDEYEDARDITYTNIKDVSDEDIEKATKDLLLYEVLPNTWMCAETSKIKVAVNTDDIKKTTTEINVDGITRNYVEEIPNINLGLELRPATKIELKKYITGFKLVAANGQTMANAYLDIEAAKQYARDNNTTLEAYLGNRDNLQGIRDNLIIIDGNWQWDGVSPTEVNTILDGANLEFVYTLVVENIGDIDYLSNKLVEEYNKGTESYKNYLNSRSDEIKNQIREAKYAIGTDLGTSYYTGGNAGSTVETEVTYIRDYLNNNLQPLANGDVEKDNEASGKKYRILRDDYTKQEVEMNTVLKTSRTTGKMTPGANDVMYTVTLTKNPISSTADLFFDTYIAEVMSFTNAAGRRSMEATPGNAEIVDEYPEETGKAHEKDESFAGNVNLMASAGEDKSTKYIIIASVFAGITIIAAGAFVVKKYVIK